MTALRDEMDLVENNPGRMTQIPEARDGRRYQEGRNYDRGGGDPRRRGPRFLDVVFDLPRGHREFCEERTDRISLGAAVLYPRRSRLSAPSQRGEAHRRSHR